MKLKFLGAAGMVTGSSYLLTSGKDSIMVDFGMFQGRHEDDGLNAIKPNIDFESLKAVILTHAHLDHCGRIPLLTGFGYKGPIYMTEATKALVELVLYDSAKIAKENEESQALYTEDDVEQVLQKVEIVKYEERFGIDGFKISMIDAGHILGSASVVVEEIKTAERIAFSGDLGNTPEPLLEPTHWVRTAKTAVVESTYGDELHGRREEMEDLAKIVQEAEAENGTVLIPSFSIERAQELLFCFDQLKKEGKGKQETLVFLDSPMAIKATQIFREYPELYSDRLKEQVKTDDPFSFPGMEVCETGEKSRMIKEIAGTKVIIAGSGMMNGGRIMHHAIDFLSNPKTQLVFVGYQADGTLGRRILEGADMVNVMGIVVKMNAKIREIKTMSSHADQEQVINWLKKIEGLKKVVLTHGEDLQRLTLKEKLHQEVPELDILIPKIDEEISI